MIAIIRRNFGYKVLSIGVAILLYYIAYTQRNPPITTEVYVQPDIVGLSDDMVVKVRPTGGMVSVTGVTTAVNAFKTLPVKATVDVAGARVGVNKLRIHYNTTPDTLDISGVAPYAEVVLERKFRKEWYVDVLFDDEPPPGYVYLDPITSPRKVTVSGLAGEVARVGRVVAIVERGQSGGEVNKQVQLLAQSDKQQGVDTVQIDPPSAQVRVPLRRVPTSKVLLLSATVEGTPAPGYAVTGYKFTPSTIAVTGAQAALGSRSALSVPVDVSGATGPLTRTVSLALPPGAVLQSGQPRQVTVRVEISPLPSGAATPAVPTPPPATSTPPPVIISATPPPTTPAPAPPITP